MAKDEETGIDPRATDGDPHDPIDPDPAGGDEAARRAGLKGLPGGKGNGGGSAKDRAANDDEPEVEPGDQTEIPLDIPGARKPTLSMNARGKPVSVEGKMRSKSFTMSGVVDDTDKIMEARVLIRFHKDQRVPVREGVGETASTKSFILRQEFDVLRMDMIAESAPATGTDG